MSLPDLPSASEIRSRLEAIFPEGISNRHYFTREMAARVVFSMLYVGAVERLGRWLGPKHVYGMSDVQAEWQAEAERLSYGDQAWRPGFKPAGHRWYADTTREPIRDETLRDGFVRVGAVILRPDIPTTSGRPRYAMRDDFAGLFDPALQGEALAAAVADWQDKHLDPLALARIELLRQGAASAMNRVDVVLPNRTVRQLVPGPSSVISKAVVEVFAPAFLYNPAVLLLSESGDKIVAQEERLIASIGLRIDRAKLLPDILLFDLEAGRELLVFVEVVATDGPISESRKQALLEIAEGARISPERIAFVTAYRDRGDPAFKKTFGTLAWNTLVWFMSEPDHVVVLRGKTTLSKGRIFELIHEKTPTPD
jgi:BsuBI/PstI restriction endonuclease domain/BsuBI/PstI restriction endonuclease HTH domain